MQAKEALGIYEQLDDVSGQARSLCQLAYLLHADRQLDAAEEAALQVISRFSSKGEQFRVCECHRVLGHICRSKGETEEAIDHFKTALEIASSFNWHDPLFWTHKSLAEAFIYKGRFDDARSHIEHAKFHAINDAYRLGHVVEQQARFWYMQQEFEEARSAASHAADVYERFEATKDLERCRALLQSLKKAEMQT